MNILNLVNAKVWGGGEQYVYDMSLELSRRHIHNIVVVDKASSYVQERFAQVAYTEIANLKLLNGLTAITKLSHLIKENKIDVVHCHSGKLALLCVMLKKLCHVKIVFFKHNALLAKVDWYHRYIRKNFDAFVCVSNLVYDLQTKGLDNEEIKKFHVVYNGIDTHRFPDTVEDNQQENTESCFTIGYAGRIAKDKGLKILIEGLYNLINTESRELQNILPKDVYLRIAGMDNKGYKAELASKVKELGLEKYVYFEGVVEDMNSFYRSLDVLVLPSSVKEAFGLVLCEAMYCKTVVITSDSGAQHEIIPSNEYGFVLQPFTSEALVKTISSLYHMPRQKKMDITERARKRVESMFTIEKMVDNMLEINEKL